MLTMAQSSRPRFIPNDPSTLLPLPVARAELLASLKPIIQGYPPTRQESPDPTLPALYFGPLSLAYLFLSISRTHPDLVLEGHDARYWCMAYLNSVPNREPLPVEDEEGNTGTDMELLVMLTLRAAVTDDISLVRKLLKAVDSQKTPAGDNELLYGRAGILVLLRVVKHFSSSLEVKDQVNAVMQSLIEHILAHRPWSWYGESYIGAAHGDIGILTQIVLSEPKYAPQLESLMMRLLDEQNEDGSWPAVRGEEEGQMVQFCHGAPGFVISLLAIRRYFPQLEERIDRSVERGRENIWQRGGLTKEPCLCHGVLGNALALEGCRRDHFLALGTDGRIENGLKEGVFEESDDKFGLLFGGGGRAWVWMMADVGKMDAPCFPGYTDI